MKLGVNLFSVRKFLKNDADDPFGELENSFRCLRRMIK